MAYATNVKSKMPVTSEVGLPHLQKLGDQTGTTTATAAAFGDLVNTGFTWFLCIKIVVKVLVGTVTFVVETADDTAFATNKRQIAVSGVMESGVLGTCCLMGWTDTTTNQYYRIVPTFGTSGTYDVEVQATQVV